MLWRPALPSSVRPPCCSVNQPLASRAIIVLVPDSEAVLLISQMLVDDDLTGQSYTIVLEDLVRAMDDPRNPVHTGEQ